MGRRECFQAGVLAGFEPFLPAIGLGHGGHQCTVHLAVGLGQALPPFMTLGLNVGLTGLTLRVEGIKFLIQALFVALTRVRWRSGYGGGYCSYYRVFPSFCGGGRKSEEAIAAPVGTGDRTRLR